MTPAEEMEIVKRAAQKHPLVCNKDLFYSNEEWGEANQNVPHITGLWFGHSVPQHFVFLYDPDRRTRLGDTIAIEEIERIVDLLVFT